MSRDVLLGIDAGTSSVKVVVADPKRGVCGEGKATYSTYTPQNNWAEQNAEEWWEATCIATRQAIDSAETQGPCNIVGIGVTGQMHSFVLVDRDGTPLRNAITWLDSRSRELVSEVREKLEHSHLTNRIANQSSASLTLVQLLWLLRNEPSIFSRATALLNAKDYIRFRLTGVIGAEMTDASATMMMDVPNRSWLGSELESLFDLPQTILPALHSSFEPAGMIIPDIAAIFSGRSQDKLPMVAYGSGDQQAAALANGIVETGLVQVMMGTGGQIATPIHAIPAIPKGSLNYFCHHEHWIAQGSLQNAGSALSWAMNMFDVSWEAVEAAAWQDSIENCPLFVPYLTGERTPVMDSQISGAWLGLRSSMNQSDLLYSAIEGVVFGFANALKELDASPREIRLGGGGSQSPGYTQLLSNCIGQPLLRMPSGNTSALGAAILGGVASGIFTTFRDGALAIGEQPQETVEPDMEQHERIALRHRKFESLRANRELLTIDAR